MELMGIDMNVSISVPPLDELAALYKQAIQTQDRQGAFIAEAAVLQLASAEAALTEAHVLAEFARITILP